MESMTQNQTKQILRFAEDILDKMNLSKNGAQQLIEAGNVFQTKLQSIISELTKEKFSFLKEFELTVPGNYDHKNQLKVFAKENEKSFYYFNDDITDKNFSQVSNQLVPGKTYKVKMWTINERVSSEECLKHLKSNKVILTGAQGNSLVYQEKKEELPVSKWTLSFDEKDKLWKDANGNHRVPGVGRYSDGDFYFGLGGFERGWGDGDCLVGFCDCQSSETEPLS